MSARAASITPSFPDLRPALEHTRRVVADLAQRPVHARRVAQEARARAAAVQGPYATVASLRDGLVTLTNGAHRALLDVRGIAWNRLTEGGQDVLLDRYAWWASTLAHPVQWTIQVRPASLDAQADALAASGTPFARDLAAYLRGLAERRGLKRRRYLLTVPSDRLDRAAAGEQLQHRAADLVATTARIGLDAHRLSDDAALGAVLRDCWYPGVAPFPGAAGDLLPPDWTPAGVGKDPDALCVDHGDGTGHWLVSWCLTWPPATLTGAWLAPLVTLDVPLDVSLHLVPLDPDGYQERLRARTRKIATMADFFALKSWLPWRGLHDAHAHHQQMATALERQQTRPYLLSLALVVRAPTRAAVLTAASRVDKELAGLGGRWRRTTQQHDLAARTCRPEGVDALGCALEVDRETVAHLLPALTATIG